MPFFSVIIPLYNKEKFVKDTLLSIINQTIKDYEIIVVDDGSTDKSLEILNALNLSNMTILTQKNSGVASARNRGISEAKGTYLALIDADDIWHPNHLEELKKQISLFPEAGLYCNNYKILHSKNTLRPTVFDFEITKNPFLVKDYFQSSTVNSVAWTSAVAFRKTDFENVGKFNEKLITYEDIDLWIRFALKYPVAFNPKVTMLYKMYVENSLTDHKDNMHRAEFLNRFKSEEKIHKSLKKYLDINRYALAIKCKISKEDNLFYSLKKTINYDNLNYKQNLLLKMPQPLLVMLKYIQKKLIKRNIYLTAFK